MTVEPHSKAQRVFVIVENGSAHRGQRSIDRLQGAWPNLILVHTPVHASWLFSIVQRKVLTPNDLPDLDTLERQLLAFGRRYEQIATPFEWKFTRNDLDRLAQRLDLPAAQAAWPNTSANFRARALRERWGSARSNRPRPSRHPRG